MTKMITTRTMQFQFGSFTTDILPPGNNLFFIVLKIRRLNIEKVTGKE